MTVTQAFETDRYLCRAEVETREDETVGRLVFTPKHRTGPAMTGNGNHLHTDDFRARLPEPPEKPKTSPLLVWLVGFPLLVALIAASIAVAALAIRFLLWSLG